MRRKTMDDSSVEKDVSKRSSSNVSELTIEVSIAESGYSSAPTSDTSSEAETLDMLTTEGESPNDIEYEEQGTDDQSIYKLSMDEEFPALTTVSTARTSESVGISYSEMLRKNIRSTSTKINNDEAKSNTEAFSVINTSVCESDDHQSSVILEACDDAPFSRNEVESEVLQPNEQNEENPETSEKTREVDIINIETENVDNSAETTLSPEVDDCAKRANIRSEFFSNFERHYNTYAVVKKTNVSSRETTEVVSNSSLEDELSIQVANIEIESKTKVKQTNLRVETPIMIARAGITSLPVEPLEVRSKNNNESAGYQGETASDDISTEYETAEEYPGTENDSENEYHETEESLQYEDFDALEATMICKDFSCEEQNCLYEHIPDDDDELCDDTTSIQGICGCSKSSLIVRENQRRKQAFQQKTPLLAIQCGPDNHRLLEWPPKDMETPPLTMLKGTIETYVTKNIPKIWVQRPAGSQSPCHVVEVSEIVETPTQKQTEKEPIIKSEENSPAVRQNQAVTYLRDHAECEQSPPVKTIGKQNPTLAVTLSEAPTSSSTPIISNESAKLNSLVTALKNTKTTPKNKGQASVDDANSTGPSGVTHRTPMIEPTPTVNTARLSPNLQLAPPTKPRKWKKETSQGGMARNPQISSASSILLISQDRTNLSEVVTPIAINKPDAPEASTFATASGCYSSSATNPTPNDVSDVRTKTRRNKQVKNIPNGFTLDDFPPLTKPEKEQNPNTTVSSSSSLFAKTPKTNNNELVRPKTQPPYTNANQNACNVRRTNMTNIPNPSFNNQSQGLLPLPFNKCVPPPDNNIGNHIAHFNNPGPGLLPLPVEMQEHQRQISNNSYAPKQVLIQREERPKFDELSIHVTCSFDKYYSQLSNNLGGPPMMLNNQQFTNLQNGQPTFNGVMNMPSTDQRQPYLMHGAPYTQSQRSAYIPRRSSVEEFKYHEFNNFAQRGFPLHQERMMFPINHTGHQ